MGKASERIIDEFKALIPPTLFFFIALHLVALDRALMLEGTGMTPGTSVSIAVAALILGKAVLIADLLPVINRYPEKPLVYNIAWKSAIYVLIALFIHYLERLVDFWRETGNLLASNERMLAEIIWPHFWSTQILLVILVLVYCTASELARVLDPGRLRKIFFGR
jgi:hypothetical protein